MDKPKAVETMPIRLRRETIKMIVRLKEYPRETYDDVVSRLCLKALKEINKKS